MAKVIHSDMQSPVLIVDDHPVVLYGLKFLLQTVDHYQVCGEASSDAEARQLTEQLQPDFIVLDLALGGRDGVELVQDLAGLAPRSRVLVYSSQSEWHFARRAIQAGARGYLSKSEGLPIVATALDIIAAGKIFMSEGLRRRLAERFDETDIHPTATTIEQLSNRELQILKLLGENHSTRQIAEILQLSIKTIGTYCERIKLKMQLDSLRDLEELARSQFQSVQRRQ